MTTLAELKSEFRIRALFEGDPSSGKTSFALQFPQPLFVLDADNKLKAGAAPRYLDSIGVDLSGIHIHVPKDYNDGAKALIEASKSNYKTIVIDSLTAWNEHILEEVRRQQKRQQYSFNQSTGAVSLPDPTKGLRESDWGDVKFLWNNFAVEIGLFPQHVICTAHLTDWKDDLTGVIIQKLSISGQSARTLPRRFDDTWLFYTKGKGDKQEYRVATCPRMPLEEKLCLTNSLGLPTDFIQDYKLIKERLTNA